MAMRYVPMATVVKYRPLCSVNSHYTASYGSLSSSFARGLVSTFLKHQKVPPQTSVNDVVIKIHPSVVMV